MTLNEIKEHILSGELVLEKTYLGKRHKRKYIWDDKTDKILKVETIEFDGWSHRAVYKDEPHKGYKISKKVYIEMLKKLSTPK